MPKRWSKEEISFLKNNYKGNLQNIAKILNRGKVGILKKAMKFGLTNRHLWLKKEDLILKQFYKKKLVEYLVKKLKRTKKSIFLRAHKLKLTRKIIWEDNEISFLLKNYNVYSKKKLANMLNKSLSTLFNKSKELGLVKPAKKWTDKEIKELCDNFYKMSLLELAILLNKTKSSVCDKANSLNLYKIKTWGEKEIIFLKKYYKIKNNNELCAVLKRTWHSIQEKARTLNLCKKTYKWTNTENGIIIKHYPSSNKKYLLKKLKNRSWEAIRVQANFLKIKRKDLKFWWKKEDEDYLIKNYPKTEDIKIVKKLKRTWEAIRTKARELKIKRDLTKLKKISKGEKLLFLILKKLVDKNIKQQYNTKWGIIDIYSPKLNMFIQYDGDFVHGRELTLDKTKVHKGSRLFGVIKSQEKDKIQNNNIKNLVRIWENDFKKAIKNDLLISFLENKLGIKIKQKNIPILYKRAIDSPRIKQ